VDGWSGADFWSEVAVIAEWHEKWVGPRLTQPAICGASFVSYNFSHRMKFPSGATMPLRPLALTDQQIDIIQRAAKLLPPRERSAFLQTIAELLSGQELGDGVVARAAAEAQRRYRDPPNLDGAEAD
jgi:hypothetical protein